MSIQRSYIKSLERRGLKLKNPKINEFEVQTASGLVRPGMS